MAITGILFHAFKHRHDCGGENRNWAARDLLSVWKRRFKATSRGIYEPSMGPNNFATEGTEITEDVLEH